MNQGRILKESTDLEEKDLEKEKNLKQVNDKQGWKKLRFWK